MTEINQEQQDKFFEQDLQLCKAKTNFWQALTELVQTATEFVKTKGNE